MSVPLVTLLGRMTLGFLEAIGAVTSFALRRRPLRSAAALVPQARSSGR